MAGLFSISYMGYIYIYIILPIDELHHFSRWLWHHQAEIYDRFKGISTTRNGQTKHASHERLEIQHVAQPCAGSSIFFIQIKPANAATTMQVECSTFQESIQEQMPFSPKQKRYISSPIPTPHSAMGQSYAIIRSPNHLRFRDGGAIAIAKRAKVKNLFDLKQAAQHGDCLSIGTICV